MKELRRTSTSLSLVELQLDGNRDKHAIFGFREDAHRWSEKKTEVICVVTEKMDWLDEPDVRLDACFLALIDTSVYSDVNSLVRSSLLGVEILDEGRVRVQTRTSRIPND